MHEGDRTAWELAMRAGDRLARTAVHALVEHLQGGAIEITDQEGTRAFGPSDAELHSAVRVDHPRAYAWALRGSTGWGEGYVERLWDTDDVVTLARIAARNLPRLDRWRRRVHPILFQLQRAARLVPANTRGGARRHISAHYDLGNELFRTFLDKHMMYSCAYFPSADADIHAAQLAKLDRICSQLELTPDDHLVEIGTGWGGLAVHAAGEYGCRVTTTTISHEQFEHARAVVAEAGLDDLVTVVDQDYRDLTGTYDKLVSIEMIEAVGWQYFPDFFAKCSSLLKPDGLMFLQAIVTNDDVYELEKASRTFSNKHIFPGGCLPSPGLITRLAATATDMRPHWVDDISSHYATTLRCWRERFEANWDHLSALGYDDRFRRLWRFYLSTSEAGFMERRIRDLQMTFAKPRWRSRETERPDALEEVGLAH
jgi:cyclopropane-fatty-acyl-phospholipid synthase